VYPSQVDGGFLERSGMVATSQDSWNSSGERYEETQHSEEHDPDAVMGSRWCALREVSSFSGAQHTAELAKLARRDGQHFESAIWLHKARSMQTGEFKRAVEKHLTGKDSEPWELLYFKIYKSQLPVIEQALETAGLMLGTTKSRGYCVIAWR
jgi:hypothetical protein